MSTRAPGPWRWHSARSRRHLHDNNGNCFAQVSMSDLACYHADAAFIVTACNAHDELVAALERIAEYCSNRGAALPSVAHMARAALAKALLP